jgi:hypothetical protein
MQIRTPIDRVAAWADHAGYLDAMAARLRAGLARIEPSDASGRSSCSPRTRCR